MEADDESLVPKPPRESAFGQFVVRVLAGLVGLYAMSVAIVVLRNLFDAGQMPQDLFWRVVFYAIADSFLLLFLAGMLLLLWAVAKPQWVVRLFVKLLVRFVLVSLVFMILVLLVQYAAGQL